MRDAKNPRLIGSAAGTGSNAGVDFLMGLVREIAAGRFRRLKTAAIYAEVPSALIKDRLGPSASGRAVRCRR